MLTNNLLVILAQKRTNASEVSRDTGIAKLTISKIINNKTDVKLSTLIRLCNSLKVSLSDLVEFLPEQWKKYVSCYHLQQNELNKSKTKTPRNNVG